MGRAPRLVIQIQPLIACSAGAIYSCDLHGRTESVMTGAPVGPSEKLTNEDLINEIDSLASELSGLRDDMRAGFEALHTQLEKTNEVLT